jgi:DNA-binding LacI/PurR family transcriptional regulator
MSRRVPSAPTLATVAAEAGVSRQTVSNALNSPELLRPDTLQRVQEAIERLGYSPNRAARSLRTRVSHLVGLRVEPAVENSANALMDRFVHSLVESTRDAGYHVLLFAADHHGEGPESAAHADEDLITGYDELLRSAAVDAFVVTDTYRGNPQAAWLAERAVPFVAFGRPWAEPGATHPWVDVDGRAGVMLAVDHLVERGHSRIAWVGWKKDSFIGEDRRSGWTDRMHEHGLSTSRLSARGEDHLDFGRRATHVLLDQEPHRVRVRQRHRGDGRAARPRRARADRRQGRCRGRLRRLHRGPGLHPGADLGAAAAGAGGRRGRQLSRRAPRPPPDPRAGPHPQPDPEHPRVLLTRQLGQKRRHQRLTA